MRVNTVTNMVVTDDGRNNKEITQPDLSPIRTETKTDCQLSMYLVSIMSRMNLNWFGPI